MSTAAQGADPAGVSLPAPDFSAPPLPPGIPRWKHFGWDGWHLRIPVDWDLAAIESGPRGGHLRLDDEFEPRLTVRWEPLRGTFNPARAVQRYLAKQRKRGRLPESQVRFGEPVPGLSRSMGKLPHETYAFELDDVRFLGFASHCPRCERAFIVEMATRATGGAGQRLAQKVLGSFGDHSQQALARWEVFGVSVDFPASMRAVTHSFHQGHVSLTVGEGTTRASLSRWSLADIHLAGATLSDFLHIHLRKRQLRQTFDTEKAFMQSHPALTFHTRKRLGESARLLVRKLLPRVSAAHLTGLIWHCQTSNRIFLLTIASNKLADIGSARLLASRVRCCKVVY